VLAQSMAISRTALRESLKVLASKGLIETRQKTGTRVRDRRYWNQLDADVLAWRCAWLPTEDLVDRLVERRRASGPPARQQAARLAPAADARPADLLDHLVVESAYRDLLHWSPFG